MSDFTHRYRWKKYRPDLFGKRCKLLTGGQKNSVLVEFEDGKRHIVSRYAVNRIKEGARA